GRGRRRWGRRHHCRRLRRRRRRGGRRVELIAIGREYGVVVEITRMGAPASKGRRERRVVDYHVAIIDADFLVRRQRVIETADRLEGEAVGIARDVIAARRGRAIPDMGIADAAADMRRQWKPGRLELIDVVEDVTHQGRLLYPAVRSD